jgi:hypothetical protein
LEHLANISRRLEHLANISSLLDEVLQCFIVTVAYNSSWKEYFIATVVGEILCLGCCSSISFTEQLHTKRDVYQVGTSWQD